MNLLLWAIPVFFVTMGLELRLSRHHAVQGYSLKDSAASLTMGIGNLVVMFSIKTVKFGLFLALYEFRFFEVPAEAWWAWIGLIFAEDFCYYWFHRGSHEVRFFWAAHVNHHSSTHYNLSTALRQSWTGPLVGWVFWVPLPLLGFHPLMIITAQAISLLYQYWLHTELIHRLGVFEWFMNTPSHHRVHHGRNPQYLDRNYAGIFIIWDRLFGTFEPEVEPVDYGLTHNLTTYHPVTIAFHEWRDMFGDVRRARTWRGRAMYLIGRPGWRESGQGKTAPMLRADWMELTQAKAEFNVAD
ncbi:MAG: sterol desaturase family protein [Myxococcota bacterium]|nr:sterol desaturase family protein [Myxococcota bacterium]